MKSSGTRSYSGIGKNSEVIRVLLFFAVYVIYKKNYSFSRVVFLFFYLTKTANKISHP